MGNCFQNPLLAYLLHQCCNGGGFEKFHSLKYLFFHVQLRGGGLKKANTCINCNYSPENFAGRDFSVWNSRGPWEEIRARLQVYERGNVCCRFNNEASKAGYNGLRTGFLIQIRIKWSWLCKCNLWGKMRIPENTSFQKHLQDARQHFIPIFSKWTFIF